MRAIDHKDLVPLLRSGSILRLEDLLGLQGTCTSLRGDELNIVVTDVFHSNFEIRIDIMEQGRAHTSALTHDLFRKAVWLATPRLEALFDAARAEQDRLFREQVARDREAAQAGAEVRARAETARRDAEVQRMRRMLLDLIADAEQDRERAAITPAHLIALGHFRDRVALRDEREAQFFSDMMHKVGAYGDRTFVSESQGAWIRDIILRAREAIRAA